MVVSGSKELLFYVNIARGPPVPPRNSLGDGKSLEYYRGHSLSR